MKLALAAACLAASFSLASQAFADGRTLITLEQPVAKPVEFVAQGGVWDCTGNICVAEATQDGTFGWSQCRAVAKQAGSRVTADSDAYHTLQQAQLDRCNANIGGSAKTNSPQTSQTAAR